MQKRSLFFFLSSFYMLYEMDTCSMMNIEVPKFGIRLPDDITEANSWTACYRLRQELYVVNFCLPSVIHRLTVDHIYIHIVLCMSSNQCSTYMSTLHYKNSMYCKWIRP